MKSNKRNFHNKLSIINCRIQFRHKNKNNIFHECLQKEMYIVYPRFDCNNKSESYSEINDKHQLFH